jgi:hypothetical protein
MKSVITGSVVSSGNSPRVGVLIKVYLRRGLQFKINNFVTNLIAETTTDENGAFSFYLNHGNYTVFFTHSLDQVNIEVPNDGLEHTLASLVKG